MRERGLKNRRAHIRTEQQHTDASWSCCDKLAILADAAKYDASCASSGHGQAQFARREGRHRLDRGHGHLPRLRAGRALHLAAQDPADQCLHLRLPLLHQPPLLERAAGALHAWTRSCTLTLGFYRRNCIEGLFLSSGIIRNPDYTMEQVVGGRAHAARGARVPRLHPPEDHPRRRPGAARRGRAAMPTGSRINVELPSEDALARLAPEKDLPRHPPLDGPHAAAHRRGAGGEEGAALRPGRAEHAGDRRRRCQPGPRRSWR